MSRYIAWTNPTADGGQLSGIADTRGLPNRLHPRPDYSPKGVHLTARWLNGNDAPLVEMKPRAWDEWDPRNRYPNRNPPRLHRPGTRHIATID